MAFLERLYKVKIQKDCPFAHNKTIDFQNGGICMDSVYKLSLKVQILIEDLKTNDLKAALNEF